MTLSNSDVLIPILLDRTHIKYSVTRNVMNGMNLLVKAMDDGLMMNALHWDIIELAGHLRQERLFVSSEQQHLQGLNEKVICFFMYLMLKSLMTV
jgi:hypothetical protein